MKRRAGLAAILCVAALFGGQPAQALDLELPVGARLTAERVSALDSFDAPIAPYYGNTVPIVTLEGEIIRRAWRISTGGLTPLQVLVPLRAQLQDLGYELAFECAAATCGGFDFRFNTEVLPGPNMYVNISQFRYLTALRGPRDAPAQAVGVLVSVTAASAYVQVILADTGVDVEGILPAREAAPLEPQDDIRRPVAPAVAAKEGNLLENGFVILDDLDFDTGTSDLSAGTYGSLTTLADLLTARPELRLVLVGHTDAVGGLQPNIELSRARARSVRNRLIEEHGIAPDRLDAEGTGYLSPVASNQTAEGRERNRRVEAVLLNLE